MNTKVLIAAIAITATGAAALIAGSAIAEGMGHGAKWQRGMGGEMERPSFETLDADGDGKITVAEVRAHGSIKFSELDSDGDGLVSAEEMSAAAGKRAEGRASMMIAKMIEWRDTDGDGMLSQAELGGGIGEKIFMHLDGDEDGAISPEEYAKLEMRGKHGGQGTRGGSGKGGFGHGGGHGGQNDG